jgi:hypothetical protein
VREQKGRSTDGFLTSLDGATVWAEGKEQSYSVLWFSNSEFDWDGPVFMRARPQDAMIIEFETIKVRRGSPRSFRLLTVRDDPEAEAADLAERLQVASA